MTERNSKPRKSAEIPIFDGRAACRDADPELFYNAEREQLKAREIREALAKEVCARCEILEACRTWALEAGVKDGVLGGLTEKEREAIWKKSRRRAG